MNERVNRLRKIHELDFAMHELNLFLDSNPENLRAMQLFGEYKRRREMAVAEFERRFGKYVVNTGQENPTTHWSWIDSPWPWENNFMEG